MQKNQTMDEIIESHGEGIEDVSVSVIESAKKPFLSHEVTYNVAYYAVSRDTAEDMDTLWALKKTPASKHEDLTRIGTAVIVVNDKTGEVVSFHYVSVNCDH